ncbi:hypothetical protein [Sporomusa sp.]|uniref:hypothetical protein n=1 Tax=Sporomusa sp. TaxID=2078658 RepID=UPI002BC566A5|nr:hypothetical protein [Sporomusa sp.]HWR07116.1 hypothetical protein [Sporomusa sp.]
MGRVKLISTKCNVCGGSLFSAVHGYYECDSCGYTLCPPEETERQSRKILLECARNDSISKPIMHTKSSNGGSKSAKGSKDTKQKMQRPSTKQIYNTLAGYSNKIKYKKID